MKHAIALILSWVLAASSIFAQKSQIVSWNDFPAQRAYEPMPVICVHGIASDSAGCWTYGVNVLSNSFSTTYFFQGKSQVSRQTTNQPGAAYVETFDYGTYGHPEDYPTKGHLQTFDSIKSNAWEGVYQNSVNHCITLSNRISEVRDAYQLGNGDFPPVTLLCHSMGGMLSHYYLTKCVAAGVDSGVARLVTPRKWSVRSS